MNVEEEFIRDLFTDGETQLGRVFVHEPVLSPENALRRKLIVSRTRWYGRSKGMPFQRSTITFEDVPMPSAKRSSRLKPHRR